MRSKPTRPSGRIGLINQITDAAYRTKAKSAKPVRNRNRNVSAKPPAVARRPTK